MHIDGDVDVFEAVNFESIFDQPDRYASLRPDSRKLVQPRNDLSCRYTVLPDPTGAAAVPVNQAEPLMKVAIGQRNRASAPPSSPWWIALRSFGNGMRAIFRALRCPSLRFNRYGPSQACSAKVPVLYYVFDLMILAGQDVTAEPMAKRRDLLQRGVLAKLGEPIRQSPELNASLPDLIASVRAQSLEGLVAKLRDSRYEPGQRSGAWQKMRVNQGQEFVIAGYTLGGGNFDAIIFGYYNVGKLTRSTTTARSLPCGMPTRWSRHLRFGTIISYW